MHIRTQDRQAYDLVTDERMWGVCVNLLQCSSAYVHLW